MRQKARDRNPGQLNPCSLTKTSALTGGCCRRPTIGEATRRAGKARSASVGTRKPATKEAAAASAPKPKEAEAKVSPR